MKRITNCTSLIRKNYYIWDRCMCKFLNQYSLNMSELIAIEALYLKEDLSLPFKEIESVTQLSQTVVVRMIEKLVLKGYVTTAIDEKDKRVKVATLTKKGIEFGNQARETMISSENTLLSDFSEKDKIAFQRFLERSLENSLRTSETIHKNKKNKDTAAQNTESNARIKVLIADDEEINRDMLADILGSEYDVVQAENGKEAINLLKEDPDSYSLIVMDLYMPKMDGFEALKKINKMDKVSQIPSVVITSEHSVKVEEECFEIGAKDFISKPFHPGIVKKRVHNLIQVYEYQKILEKKINNM